MKVYLVSFFILLTLIYCSNEKIAKTDFLSFELGMSKEAFEISIDSLLTQNKIYKSSRRNYYKYNFNADEQKIRASINANFEYDELREINILIGELTKPDNARNTGNGVFFMFHKGNRKEIESLFELYKSKYGEPRVKNDWEEPIQTYEWVLGDKTIIFDKGLDESYFVKNASIKYQFSEEYLLERNAKSKKISNDKSLNEI